jgi:DNA recombination protein RmuC
MEIILSLLLGLALGTAATFLWLRARYAADLSKAEAQRQYAEKEAAHLAADLERQRAESTAALERQKTESRQQMAESRQQMAESMATMKEQFLSLSQSVLDKQASKFAQADSERLEAVVKPLHDHLQTLGRALQDAGEKAAARKLSFDEAMERLARQTTEMASETDRLTRALKGESKTQGNWGEMLLSSILENSGLRRGEEYFPQEHVRGEGGSDRYPDVVVRFPSDRSVIIDSKVSLTAYMDYLNATDDDTRRKATQAHVVSVRNHVRELAGKNYPGLVKNAGNYVLMFLQSDAAYILAVKNDPKLNEDAFRQHVIIVSPTTLMMTLQIIYNIWQSDRQARNVERIVSKAGALYDKIATFTESFREIDRHLSRASKAYGTALNQLCEGRGNIVNRVEEFRQMGISPKKAIAEDLTDKSDSETATADGETGKA